MGFTLSVRGKPGWFTDLADWEVTNFAGNSDAVAPSPVPDPGSHNWFGAWSSGDYDSVRDQWVGWGGGHGDYSGNELYGWGPYRSNSPGWYRITNPSTDTSTTTDGAYNDGLPAVPHVYDMMCFAPPNLLVQFGQSAPYDLTTSVWNLWSYDLSRADSDKYQRALNGWTKEQDTVDVSIDGIQKQGCTVYNTLDGLVYYYSGFSSAGDRAIGTWDPVSNVLASVIRQPTEELGEGVAAFSPDHGTNGIMVVMSANAKVVVADLSDGSTYNMAMTGDTFVGDSDYGLIYDPLRQVFVAYTENTTFLVDMQPPANVFTGTWTFVNRTTSGDALPASTVATGMFKKMVYVSSLHAVSIMAQYTSGVHIVRLPEA